MVFFIQSLVSDDYVIYMGRDKHENERLIKWGFPEDYWFHVDTLSSAHVYLRLPSGAKIADVPDAVIEACAQFVKANSIEGCKLPTVDVIYTPWSNLEKTPGMEAGAVNFKDRRLVTTRSVTKNSTLVRQLTKTKVWREIDYRKERENRDRRVKEEERRERRKAAREEEKLAAQRKKEKEAASYDRLYEEDDYDGMTNDHGMSAEDFESGFM